MTRTREENAADLAFEEAQRGKLETPRMLVLSTRHIKRTTEVALTDYLEGSIPGVLCAPLCFAKADQGFLLPIIGEPDSEDEARRWDTYPELRAIRQLAEANDCTWIMLDCDADVVDGLPTYEW